MDDDLTNRVERALLGALITDPGLRAPLEYVQPRDFADDLHRAIYTAIWSVRDATASSSAGDRIADVARVAGRQVSEVYVRELAASCPDPRHGAAYGLRLVQAALYRQMSHSADALGAQAAVLASEGARVIETGADSGPQVYDAGRHLELISAAPRSHTAALVPATRLAKAPRTRPQQPTTSQERDAQPVSETRKPTPDQATRPATAMQSSAVPPAGLASGQELREEHVLTALLQQHRESDQILAFLPAAAFTSPDRQEIIRAIRRLRQVNEPVDELTVIWELRIGSDSPSQMQDNSDLDYGTRTSVIRLASASTAGQSPSKAARELLSQLDRSTPSDWQPARHTQPSQAPVHASPSASAGFSATQAPEAGGPQQGREPRR